MLAHKTRIKFPRNSKICSLVAHATDNNAHQFQGENIVGQGYQVDYCLNRKCIIYTVIQKKTPPYFISRILVKHCPILIIFGKIFVRYIGLNGWFYFPPHIICVPALPEETKNVNLANWPVILLSHLVN